MFHIHSFYSYDAISSPEQICLWYKERGFNWFTITDHGNVSCWPEAFEVAKKHDMIFAPGIEFYLINEDHTKLSHLTCVAFNNEGMKNICKIISEGGFYYHDYVTKESILNHNEGLIIGSGCLASETKRILEAGETPDELWKQYIDALGERFLAEVSPQNTKEDKGVVELAKKYNRRLFCGTDSHYPTAKDHDTWKFVLEWNPEDDYDLSMSVPIPAEFVDPTNETVAWFENMLMANPPQMVKIVNDQKDEDVIKFEEKVWEGFKSIRVGTEYESESKKRVEYELGIIKDKKFCSYFMTILDYIEVAKDNGIPVGPGRGSAAGSECLFLSGITKIDPLKYGLFFERFLNPGRTAMPDVDLDFAESVCKNYMKET